MEITEHTSERLIIEEKAWLTRVVVAAVLVSGIVLILSNMREHGVQSWYRTTYWLGGVLALGAGVVYVTFITSSRLILTKASGRLVLWITKGVRTSKHLNVNFSSVTDIRLDKKGNTSDPEQRASQARYRLSVQVSGEKWYPLSHSFHADLDEVRRIGEAVQGFMLAAQKE